MTEEPILTVMWHGNRVHVFADGRLGKDKIRTAKPRVQAMGEIAGVMTLAESVREIVAGLERSSVGDHFFGSQLPSLKGRGPRRGTGRIRILP